MAEAADLILRASVAGGREAVTTLDQIDAAAKRAEKSADGFSAGESRLERQLQQADAALKRHQRELEATVIDFNAFYQASQRDFHTQWVRGANQFVAATNRAGAASRLATYEVVNLGRQITDVGVMAAMGANPLMILALQGAQIGEVFSVAGVRGVSFKNAMVGLAATARNLIAAYGAMIATLGGLGVAVLAVTEGFSQMNRVTEDAEKSALGYAGAMAMAEEAINGVAIATWKLADARKEAARQALNEQIASNNEALNNINNPGFWGMVGRGFGTIAGAYRGQEVAAEAERLRQRNADLMAEGIRLLLDESQDAAAAYDRLLPRLKQIEEIEQQRAVIQRTLQGGAEALTKAGLTEAEAREAIAAADKKIADLRLSPEARKAAEEAKRLAEAEAKRRQATIESADQGIRKLRDEIEEIGQAEEAVRRLQIARQMAEAPLLRQKLLIKQLGEEREAALKLADAWERLDALYKRLTSRTLTPLQEAQAENVKLLNDIADPRYPGAISALGEAAKLAADVDETWARAHAAVNVELAKTPDHLNEAAKEIETARERVERLADAFGDVRYSIDDMFSSLKRGDIGGFLLNVQGMISGIGTLLAQGPGGALALGSIAANTVGGKAARAVGGGLGIAAGGLFAGSQLMGAASMGLLGSGALAGGAMALAPILGPIGLAAGALYAAVKLFNVGGKPTNAGAGFDLVTGQISGNKRTEETEQAARQAGETILAIQDSLKAAGIGLTDSVRGLVIGTRDQTQIYLQSGRELRSAVGDAGAAVDTALKALLEGATYVSDAQKKLVDSALAAGKGFDAIAEILAKYEAAQNITKGLADEILRLTDPKAYDLKAVTDAIEEQRKAAKALADEGYLTADQLSTINGQLDTLKGLQIDDVLKRYTDAVNDNAAVLEQTQAWASGLVGAAQNELVAAYNREADVHRQAAAQYRQIAEGLRAFGRELTVGSLSGNNPFEQYRRTSAEFARLNAMAPNDPERLANLTTVGRAFIEARRFISPSEAALNRDIEAVRRATEASEKAAEVQATIEEQQLAALTAQVGQLVQLNTNLLTVAQAIVGLQNALAVAGQVGVPGNDNVPPIDVNRYLAGNPDLAKNWMAGGSLRQAGSTLEEAALAHWRTTGHLEVAAGLRKYAAGGVHPGGWRLVGEEGPELEATGPARYFSADQTREMLSGGNGEAMRVLASELTQHRAELASIRRAVERTALEVQKMQGNGLYVRGRSPDDPVTTEAA